MKKIIYSVLILLNSLQIFGQCGSGPSLTVNNPSFEGTPQPHVTPPGWDICMPGVTPDTQPGSWGCTLPPSNGTSYIGLVYSPSANWQEGCGQTLSSPMVAGTTYSFTIDLATMATADPATGILLPPWCEYLELWGGMSGVNSGCDKAELLWSSPTVTNTTWQSYSLVFTPTQNWNHILFLINTPTPACTDGQYLLMDNMSPISPLADIAEFSWTSYPDSTSLSDSSYNADSTHNMGTCLGSIIQFADSSTSFSGVITGRIWNFGDGTPTTTIANPSHTFTTPGTYNVTLITYSSVPCTTTMVHVVNVWPIPTVTASASPSTMCTGQSSTLTGGGATTYSWLPGGATGTTITVTPATSTTYTVTGTTNGCSATSSVNVAVVQNITVMATSNPSIICAGQSSTLSGGGAISYQWEPGTLSGNSIVVAPTTSTIYSVTGNNSGCTGSTTVTVDVYPNPDVVFASDKTEGCEDLLIQFSDLSNITNATWYWDFGDYGFSYLQNPQHLYVNPGVYDVSLTITTQYGCTSTFVWHDMITVFKMPLAYFTPNPTNVSELDPTVFFNDQSIGTDGWNWNFGDTTHLNNVSNQPDPTHTFSDTGSYTITLVAITNDGCTDTIRHDIYVEPNVSYYLPNAFSPNDDGRNGNFTMQGEGIKWSTFVMRIYDRWGKTLYYTNDNEKGWDGSLKGKVAPQGIYTYLVTFTDIKFREYKIKGFVVLIK